MSTVSSDSVAQDQIKAFVERIERLEEERKSIAGDIAEVYAEAKGNGFDRKALKAVVRIRAMNHDDRMEHEALVDLYLSALGMAAAPADDEDDNVVSFTRAPAPARAHVESIEEFHATMSAETEPDAAMRPKTGGSETLVAKPDATPAAAVVANGSGATAGETAAGEAEDRLDGEVSSAPYSEPAPAILPSPDGAGAVAASRSAVDPTAAPAAPVRDDYSKPNPACADPDECGVHGSWNFTCGTRLRRAAARQAEQRAVH